MRREDARAAVLSAYGGRCACCGESAAPFLTIDHVNNDGAAHRMRLFGRVNSAGQTFYLHLANSGFPNDPPLQVLCANRNLGKVNGRCPHDRPPRAGTEGFRVPDSVRTKRSAIDAYGSICHCCSESELVFLALDHVNGDGAEHRRALKEEGFVQRQRRALLPLFAQNGLAQRPPSSSCVSQLQFRHNIRASVPAPNEKGERVTTAIEVVAGRPGATVVSYSELDTGRQCPHKHALAYKERWTQEKDETTAAGRGTLWHKVMDSHYTALKVGENPRFAVEQRLSDFRSMGKDLDTIDLLMWMYEGYVEKWGLDDRWEVLVVEYKTIVPLRYAPTKPGKLGRVSKFDLKMIIDLVIRDRDTGRIWIIDHKSHANLPKQRELELDDQFGLYTWGLRELGHKIFGCIYNTARTTRNKGDHPENLEEWHRKKAAGEKPGALPKKQTLDERYDRYLMNRTLAETNAAAQDALSTALNLYSKANRGERHTNSDTCRWKCDFTEACLLGRKTDDNRERQFLGDIGFKQNYTRH